MSYPLLLLASFPLLLRACVWLRPSWCGDGCGVNGARVLRRGDSCFFNKRITRIATHRSVITRVHGLGLVTLGLLMRRVVRRGVGRWS